MDQCKCDYSYICDLCQAKIDIENNKRLEEKWRAWTVQSIHRIASKLDVKLPEEPS